MFWSRKQNERRNYKQSFNTTYYSPETCAWLLTGSERKGMINLSYFMAHETDISHRLISIFRSAGTCGGIFKTVNKKSLMLLESIYFHNSCWLFFSLWVHVSNKETHAYSRSDYIIFRNFQILTLYFLECLIYYLPIFL